MNVLYFAIIGLPGINFLVEFFINIVLTPAIDRIVSVVKKK